MDWLTGDHAGDGGAVVHGVGIHHPGHHFGVGADVRRRNVFLWPDDEADFAGVAAGQSLQFTFRQFERIDADAALGTAVRQVDRGALDGHPGGQGHHFVQIDVRVEADTAFARPTRQVVLYAETFEVTDGAIVHLQRDIDNQSALRMTQRINPA